MKSTCNPEDIVRDPARLAALRNTGLLDTPASEGFDRITRLAADVLRAPASFISLVDEHRDFYLSSRGFAEPLASERELRGQTFCHFSIAGAAPLIIPDTKASPQYRHVPTVESLGVAAYLGIPLTLTTGETIGALCVIDHVPREWTAVDVRCAQDLADLVTTEIELRQAVTSEVAHAAVRQALLETVFDGLVEMDANGICTLINPAGALLLGYESEELVGAVFHNIVHHTRSDLRPYPAPESPIWRCAGGGVPAHVDVEVFWRKDGSSLPVEYACSPIRLDGKPGGAVVTFRDMTRKLQLAEHLRQSRTMDALGSLAGGIAHDFNNLLTVIRMNAELLEPGVSAERQFELAEVVTATERATALTRRLLAYSRRQFLSPQPTNLNAVVRGIQTMLRRLVPETVDMVDTLDPTLHAVNVDPAQMEQVITGLVINARDALSASGRITIETRNVHSSHADGRSSGLPFGAHVMLSVSDNGSGMSTEVRARAFEPFFTTKREGEGAGLGLSMVYGIVNQSGGEIRLLSERDRGTRVQMFFPAVAAIEAAAPGVPLAPLGGTETILVVDDQPEIRKAARRLLEGLGYSIHEASGGAEALDQVGRLGGDVDLVLTDLTMPGMGGRELARRLDATAAGTKVLFMSGFSAETAAASRFDPRMNRLLQKPFSRNDLARAVRMELDRGGE